MQRAASLEEVYQVLSPEPLREKQELEEFYRPELNEIRGGNRLEHFCLGLERAFAKTSFKAFLMGHQGVGKSTELAKLSQKVETKFRTITLNAISDLNPINLQPFDVVLLMMMEVTEQTAKAAKAPSNARLREVFEWYETTKTTEKKETLIGTSAEAGIGSSPDSILAPIFGFFGVWKGEMKYASARTTETVRYRLSQISTLINAANSLIDECNKLLKDAYDQEWLFIWEGFDRQDAFPPEKIEDLFVTFGKIWQDLRAHLIITIPIDFGNNKSGQLPFKCHIIPDTPVFDPEHAPHEDGRKALRAIINARLSTELFESDQLERLIAASGGNLRDLFALVRDAADTSLLAGRKKIDAGAVKQAILHLRSEYERRLGQYVHDKTAVPVTYKQQAERLLSIYNHDKTAEINDPVLTSLFRARAVLEFNGERWIGVHPLVVDILHKQGKIEKNEQGVVPGGTE